LDTYREALYLADRARADVIEAGVPGSYAAMKEQLLTSVGSIAANIAEGYRRPTTADRVRFLSYALGSAREVLTWYQTFPSSIDRAAFDDRIARLARIRRMLLGLLTRLRKNSGRKFDPW
jgi:four helix bundle protein